MNFLTMRPAWRHVTVALMALLMLGACKTTREPSSSSPATTSSAPAGSMDRQPSQQPMTATSASGIIPLDPAVRTGVLPNGMRYYVQQNAKPEGLAELRLAVNAGSMQEADDQVGLAHFVEHMCFNGTTNFPKSDLVDYLEGIGVRFGAHLNAYTSFDETVYMLRLPTTDAEKFNKGFQILEDWATAVSFDPEEIEKERGVVISEWRTRLGGDNRLQMQILPKQFYQSRYAIRLPIGTVANLETFPHDRLIQFYKDWYRPDLMSIIAVGDFDPAEMEAKIKASFGQIPARKGPEKTIYEVPAHEETQVAIAKDAEATFNRVSVMYKHPRQEVVTEQDFLRDLTYDLVNLMVNERLDALTQSENPPFSSAGAYYGRMVRSKDMFGMDAYVTDSTAASGMGALYRECLRAARFGFTESELARAKAAVLAQLEQQFREKDKTESRRIATQYVGHFLNGTVVPGPEATLRLAEAMLPQIDSRKTNEAMRFFMSSSSRVVVISGNEKPGYPFPSEAEILSVLNKISAEELEPYEDNVSDAPLMPVLPTPGAVSSRSVKEDLGITELTFANGVRVVLKPTTFSNDEILMEAFSPGGHSLVSDQEYLSAAMAIEAITAGGVAGFDNIQLSKFLSDKVVEISPYINELSEGMEGSCAPKDLETFLQLVHLYMVSPRPDEGAFRSMQARMQGLYANLMNNPEIYFQFSIPNSLYNGHPRRDVVKLYQGMSEVDFATAERVYRERMGNAGDFTFVFVGNFEVAAMETMLAKYLGSLPGKPGKESFRDVGANAAEGELKETFRKGTEPKSLVNLVYHGDLAWSGENRYLLQSTVAVLNIMLRESLREKMGGVYGVGIRGSAQRDPKENYSITINFTCDPAMVDSLIAASHEEIASLIANGPSEQNLAKVKETQKKGVEEGLLENAFWLEQLTYAYEYGLDASKILTQAQRIDALQAEQVKAMAAKLFAEHYAEFVLKPEE